MKKKILFAAYTLDVGGIETALVNLLNELIEKYDITLVLEKKQGIFLSDLNYRINIINYNPSHHKIAFIRKVINLIKRIKFIIKNIYKFDFSASFATYSKMGSFCARIASKNNALWCHAKYSKIFENENQMKDFFEEIKYQKFSNIVFVSQEGADDFKNVFPQKTDNVIVCNNMIDYKNIINKSKEKIEYKKNDRPLFINISRHEEKQKRLTRIIEASKMLKEENFEFEILMIGSGPDTDKYKKMVEENNLEKNIIFLGELKNPYPYFKIGDSLILTSEYEGYPVVFIEAMILGLPILTTNVSDSKAEIDNKYGIVIDSTQPKAIAEKMKEIIMNNGKYRTQFNAEEFNNNIINRIEEIINGGSNAKN